jgi:hypothetical protein
MSQRLALFVTSLVVATLFSSAVQARNLFFRQPRLAEPEELVAPPPPPLIMRPDAVQGRSWQKGSPYVVQKSVASAACVRYVQHRPCRDVCCDGRASWQTTLSVYNPYTCCSVEVPVCLPACCTGNPSVAGHRGLLGRGITTFNWCCGYQVRVVVGRHDVVVHYYGA